MPATAVAPNPSPSADPAAPAARAADSYQLFRGILPPALLNAQQPPAAQAVYTPFVTTWLLIHQRLHGGASLNDAVAALLFNFPQEDLPDCKRIKEDTLSSDSSGYGKARKRLDLEVARWLTERVFATLSGRCRPAWKGRRVQLLDGTTFSLAPAAALREAFPPATNQYGPSHWPVLHVVVTHDLDSGLVGVPEWGPMYGPDNQCESVLARRLLRRLEPYSLVLGDGNFGIFIVAYEATRATHDVLFRLSQPRFAALLRQAKPLGAGCWEVVWQPSACERNKYDDLPQGACVRGYLAEVSITEGGKQEKLYLFTTLADESSAELAALYQLRWCVETDIAACKVTLGLGGVEGKTREMVEKEVLLATVAYNLVVAVRRLAAARAKVQPRRLSFAGTLSLLKGFQARVAAGGLSEEQLQKLFDKLLRACGQRKLPNRPGRHYPRELIPRRRRYPERKRGQPQAGPPSDGG
jgi:hypothetical protein